MYKIILTIIINFFITTQAFSTNKLLSVQDGVLAYKNKKHTKAFEIMHYHADRYEPIAQFYLFKMYYIGNGVNKNHSKAIYWLEQAAWQNHPQSLYNLGVLYYKGIGVKRNYQTALDFFIRASERGYPKAIYNIGLMYQLGQGIKKSSAIAAKYFIASAELGDKFSQNNLGLLYKNGEGIKKSYVKAYIWLTLAEKDGYPLAKINKSKITKWLTDEQLESALSKIRQWKPKVFSNLGYNDNGPELPSETVQRKRLQKLYNVISKPPSFYKKSTGTGFAINSDGYILTNNHVINECHHIKYLTKGKEAEITLVKSDIDNDLAILKLQKNTISGIAYFEDKTVISPGEDIYTLGYPLQNILSNEPVFTNGIINALNGYKGNSDFFQINAPIQPGNSGSPLLNNYGNIVGMVTSSLPYHRQGAAQNVNFAIKNSSIKQFLDSARIIYRTRQTGTKLNKKEIFLKASLFTSKIICFEEFYEF